MPDFNSHTEAFGQGINHAVNEGATNEGTLSPGLDQDAASYNAQVPSGFSAHSVLTPLTPNPGGDGMSADNAAKRTLTGEFMGSGNGVSAANYEQASMLKLMGTPGEGLGE